MEVQNLIPTVLAPEINVLTKPVPTTLYDNIPAKEGIVDKIKNLSGILFTLQTAQILIGLALVYAAYKNLTSEKCGNVTTRVLKTEFDKTIYQVKDNTVYKKADSKVDATDQFNIKIGTENNDVYEDRMQSVKINKSTLEKATSVLIALTGAVLAFAAITGKVFGVLSGYSLLFLGVTALVGLNISYYGATKKYALTGYNSVKAYDYKQYMPDGNTHKVVYNKLPFLNSLPAMGFKAVQHAALASFSSIILANKFGYADKVLSLFGDISTVLPAGLTPIQGALLAFAAINILFSIVDNLYTKEAQKESCENTNNLMKGVLLSGTCFAASALFGGQIGTALNVISCAFSAIGILCSAKEVCSDIKLARVEEAVREESRDRPIA